MDFVTFPFAPNFNILSYEACIVSHSRMLILLIFIVYFCKEQITKVNYQVLTASRILKN